jgi:replication factor C subunit 3/5
VNDNGYAVCDIVSELSERIILVDLPDPVMAHIIDKLSTVEFRLSHGVTERVQIGALVGAFTVARNMMI